MKMKSKILSFCCNKNGVTAIEYALIASLVAIVIIVSVSATGVSLNALYQKVADAFKSLGF
ncbi:MAG: Flp family type IVb pilin [Desulfobulbaceae bacterium]|nr:Flp family type IVb pilin [Desulfobulbaceae bacterium]